MVLLEGCSFSMFYMGFDPNPLTKSPKGFRLNPLLYMFYVKSYQMNDLESELERRTLTYTVWDQPTNKMENTGWHPVTFTYKSCSRQKIKEIQVL